MLVYNVKKIQLLSILKIFPIIFVILGTIVGLFSFFFLPFFLITFDLAVSFSFTVKKLLLFFIFVVFYTLIMTAGSIVIAWIYNFVAEKLNGGVMISIESKTD
jgi:hypothetical protein